MNRLIVAAFFAAALLGSSVAAQLPALSWTCPMHPEIVEGRRGKCSVCGMALEPVRLVARYTCPVHAIIDQSNPGKCRICRRELVAMTAELTFTCAGQPEISELERGSCADGSAMVPKYTQRAHGDHNPKHGGMFFMAPDNRHHLEGTYPAAGRLRIYLYDDYSRPLKPEDARKVRGRIVVKEVFDPKTGTTQELVSAPLVLARTGGFLEARIEALPLPARVTAKIAFGSNDTEHRFDFSFPEYSKDLPPRVTTLAAANTPAATAGNPDALLADLKARRAEVESLVENGSFAAVYVPALQAKDIALQIQVRHADSRIDQDALEASVKLIVVAAYQLDNYGDTGDGEKVRDAFTTLTAGVGALDSLLAGVR